MNQLRRIAARKYNLAEAASPLLMVDTIEIPAEYVSWIYFLVQNHGPTIKNFNRDWPKAFQSLKKKIGKGIGLRLEDEEIDFLTFLLERTLKYDVYPQVARQHQELLFFVKSNTKRDYHDE